MSFYYLYSIYRHIYLLYIHSEIIPLIPIAQKPQMEEVVNYDRLTPVQSLDTIDNIEVNFNPPAAMIIISNDTAPCSITTNAEDVAHEASASAPAVTVRSAIVVVNTDDNAILVSKTNTYLYY